MRYILLLLCLVAIHAQAQNFKFFNDRAIDTTFEINGNKIKLKKLSGENNITHIYKLHDTILLAQMPNAITNFKDEQKKIGNNQQGFDVYLSQVDQMPILKPDAENTACLKAMTGVKQLPSYKIQLKNKPFKLLKPQVGKEKSLLQILPSK